MTGRVSSWICSCGYPNTGDACTDCGKGRPATFGTSDSLSEDSKQPSKPGRVPYLLHYISADRPGPDAPWSVYVEEYERREDNEPIDGTQRHVSTWPTEEEAHAEACRLQATANAPARTQT